MRRIALPTVLPIAALLVALCANAQVYEWKDEKGKTHYSDKPPTSSAPARKVGDSGSGATPPAAQSTAAERELDFRKRQKDAQDKAEKDRQQQTAAREKADACEAAHRQLELLESGERIVQRDANGERAYLDDAQRQQETEKTRRLIQSACTP